MFNIDEDNVETFESATAERRRIIQWLMEQGISKGDAFEVGYGLYMLGYNRAEKIYQETNKD